MYSDQTQKYWEREEPIVIESERNVLRFFPQSGKLQVSLPNWEDSGGSVRPGKTVTVDIEALELSPDIDSLVRVIQMILSRIQDD